MKYFMTCCPFGFFFFWISESDFFLGFAGWPSSSSSIVEVVQFSFSENTSFCFTTLRVEVWLAMAEGLFWNILIIKTALIS